MADNSITSVEDIDIPKNTNTTVIPTDSTKSQQQETEGQKQGLPPAVDPSHNPTEQMIRHINYDVKNLKEEDLLFRVADLVCALQRLNEYYRPATMDILKSIDETYCSYRALRHKVGSILVKGRFAESTMKILKALNSEDILNNESVWLVAYYSLTTLWNYSDACSEFAKSIAENEGVDFFTSNCDHVPYITNLHLQKVNHVVRASMSILHNISRVTDSHHQFNEHGTAKVMLKFATQKDLRDEMLQVVSLLTLAHIVEEKDNKTLIDETGAINSCVKFIQNGINEKERRYWGFTPYEVMDGLGKLAVNDKNKKKIIAGGALPVFLELLTGGNIQEQSITARAIWTLSFDKDVSQQIVEFPEMMDTLQSLNESQSKVLKNVNGALFVLKGENDVSKRPKSGKKNKGHIFISYAWSQKDIVMNIWDRLKREGLDVWIDVERMGGSTLSSMAEAVENAAVVLVCMSERYKLSPNCRLEAEYTIQLCKEYIPLILQQGYQPDGWLGLIRGAKLYHDFSGRQPFETQWNGLMRDLKRMEQLTFLDNQGLGASRLSHMTKEDVANWLVSLNLNRCVPSFAQFDGELLSQLKSMKAESAEFYYRCLEKNMNMNLVEILSFTKWLEKL